MVKKIFLLVAIGCLFFANGEANESFSLSGYVKSFLMVFDMPSTLQEGLSTDTPPLGAVHNRLRLKVSYTPSPWLAVHAAYDVSPRIQDPLFFRESIYFSTLSPPSYRAYDFDSRLYPAEGAEVESFGLFHNLDRLDVTFKTTFGDLILGRQAIAWGSARTVNPTDVVAPFAFNELDTEERRGVDAVRLRIPIGRMAELDLGIIAGHQWDMRQGAFYARGKFYLWNSDLSLLVLGFGDDLMLGFDLARSIGGAGYWLEAAYVIGGALRDPEGVGGEVSNYIRLSTGLDYSFSGSIYAFLEYHFNGAGRGESTEYSRLFSSNAYRYGSVYFVARHYLIGGVTWQISPLIPFTGSIITNLNDGSFILVPRIEYNLAENVYLAAGAFWGVGKGPELRPVEPESAIYSLRSEFGAYPRTLFTSFRIYF